MIKVTEPEMLTSLENGNRFIGELPEMVNSSVTFSGRNNVLFCGKKVRLNNTNIKFSGSNSIVYLCENYNDYKLNVNVYNNNVFYSGKDNYFNGVMNVILSEQKHFFIGNDCLLSFGIWVRNADPHLIYDAESRQRINPTKSIFIGDHVWVGQSAMILKGTQAESGSIIGAMSVVSNKKITANSSWAGNPAKRIRDGVFWDRPCVHAWIDEQTNESLQFDGEGYIFSYKEDEFVSFDEIEKKLDAKNSVDSKLEYLGKISADEKRNRFCCKKEEEPKGWFERLFGSKKEKKR